MPREVFTYDVEQLLVPIPGDEPCGPSMLFDAAFGHIRQAREEDDPTLPMGEWERPLKKADWSAVSDQCISLLSSKTKDLQVAAWLCEAWTRQHQMAGFSAGALLLTRLVERFWDKVHPLIEDGDADARTAPFFWLNENLPLTLRLYVPLLSLPDYRPPYVNLSQWEQSLAAESSAQDDSAGHLSRDQLITLAEGNNLHWVADLSDELQRAIPQWDALSRLLDDKLALDAPSLGKVSDALRKLQRACSVLLEGRDPRQAVDEAPTHEPAMHDAAQPPSEPDEEPPMTADTAAPHGGDTGVAAMPAGPITSRAEAYRMLEAAAAYLQRTEPHSPTPYLVKRAVAWGQMSLADLMQEILREEGDLTRYFSLLGLNPPRG